MWYLIFKYRELYKVRIDLQKVTLEAPLAADTDLDRVFIAPGRELMSGIRKLPELEAC